LADIEVIQSSSRAGELYLELVKNAKEEVLFIFPTSNAYIRQEKMGAIPLAVDAAKERAARYEIGSPVVLNSFSIFGDDQFSNCY